jgi:O-antigen/teichoic acid export membrane protein
MRFWTKLKNSCGNSNLTLNVAFNYFSKIYVAILAVVVMPVYIDIIGVEGYGLVGIYVMVQSWLQVLDVGLSSTLAREVAMARDDKRSYALVSFQLKIIFSVFLVIATLIFLTSLTLSDLISTRWLNIGSLDRQTAAFAIATIGATVGVRWACGPLKSVLVGREELVKLNVTLVAVASVRYIGVIPFVTILSKGPYDVVCLFFTFQGLVAVLELLFLYFQASQNTKLFSAKAPLGWVKDTRRVLKFSLSVATSSWLWIVITQLDKIFLSKDLPLARFGAFTAAITVASSVSMLTAPVAQAILPRLARMGGGADWDRYIALYDTAASRFTLYLSAVPMFLFFFSSEILLTWTGNEFIAGEGAVPLSLYALGNWIMAVASFLYFLQHSRGDLRLHNRLLASMAVCLAVAVPYISSVYGSVGTGTLWVVVSLAYLTFGGRLVNKSFHAVGIGRWLAARILPHSCISAVVFYVGNRLYSGLDSRYIILSDSVFVLGVFFFILALTTIGLSLAVERCISDGGAACDKRL